MSQSEIWLQSSDGVKLLVDETAVKRSVLIRNLLGDSGGTQIREENPIPLSEVEGAVLRRVIQWCDHHKTEPIPEDSDGEDKSVNIGEWDQDFIKVDLDLLFEIILAANYLDINALYQFGCETIANMIKGKSPDDIRALFGITGEFTHEEEEWLME